MKTINVPELQLTTSEPTIIDIDKAFEAINVPYHKIDTLNWAKDFPLKPEVEFAIAHANNNIYVRYNVVEDAMRVKYIVDSGSEPYEDSCVEFFISLDDSTYYNIESNCVGAVLFGEGKGRNRFRHGDPVTQHILRYPTMECQQVDAQSGDYKWSLTMVVPANLLGVGSDFQLKGTTAMANFYKCGDMMPKAHFLSWNPIKFEKPNFHLPEFFGEIKFE